MRAIVKEVGKSPRVEDIKYDLETMQKLVGGYLEVVNMGHGICLVCNEEAKIYDLPVNFGLGYDTINGTAVFVAKGNGGDFADLSDAQERAVMNFLG